MINQRMTRSERSIVYGTEEAMSEATTHRLPVDFETICGHEAAHAVMRWVCGECSTMATD